MKTLIFSVVMLLPAFVNAQEGQPRFTMEWPLKCIPNVDCFVDAYPDLSAGQEEGREVDYGCGKRTAFGMTATEVIFVDRKHSVGQDVLAVAPGRVVLVQNKVSDTKHMHPRGKFACGNEVRIRHINDYETRYCHMQKGSVGVEVGQIVTAGDILGKTGKSGATTNPKFAFEVRKEGQLLDPFSNQRLDGPKPCFSGRDRSLWTTPVAYKPAGVMSSGFTRSTPRPHEIERDMTSGQEWLTVSARQISAWVRVYGVKEGDVETFTLLNPKDIQVHSRSKTYGRDFPYWFTGINVPMPQGPEVGLWQAVYTLHRGEEEVLRHAFFAKVHPPEAKEPAKPEVDSQPPHAADHKKVEPQH